MKKLLLILFILPIISLAQCGFIDEQNIIGAEISFSSLKNKLEKDGKISISNVIKDVDTYSWSLNDKILRINRNDYSYFLDLKSGIYNGKIVKTWSLKNGQKFVSKLNDWQKFDEKYYLFFKDSGFSNYNLCIKSFIEKKMRIWEKKGEFEKTITFNERVNKDSRRIKIKDLEKEAVNFYKNELINSLKSSDFKISDYNADNETFKIIISDLEAINFPVPISKAENFKLNFKHINFSNLDFLYFENGLIVSKIDINGFRYNLFSND